MRQEREKGGGTRVAQGDQGKLRPAGGQERSLAKERGGERPDVLAGVVEVDDLAALPEVLGDQVPDPRCPIPQHGHAAQRRETAARSLLAHHVERPRRAASASNRGPKDSGASRAATSLSAAGSPSTCPPTTPNFTSCQPS